MPLLPGKKNIGANIGELIRSGRDPKQAAAIAYSNARKTGSDIPKKNAGGYLDEDKNEFKKDTYYNKLRSMMLKGKQ